MDKTLSSSLCVIGLIIAGYLAYALFQAPKPNYDDKQFSLKIAEKYLAEIAKDTHPVGSSEHNRVREYIADQAKSMGYQVQLDTLVDYQSYRGYSMVTDIKNIIITKKGSDPKGTVAFAAHYDSQPNTLGAADDGAPIAAMLSLMETNKDKSFKNDIVFIITDGEEIGLSGAALFTKLNPLAPKLNYLFNFEARGNAGPVLGFEPNEKNNHIMDMYLDLDHTFGSSLMYDVYRLMPNDTDFTHFKKLNLGGISMAMIDGFVNYHSMTDSPENISPRSFYHHGKIIGQLIERFGDDELNATHDYDMTYFNTVGTHSVQYRPFWNIVMWILSIVLFIFYVPIRNENFKIPKILIGLFGAILLLAISLGLTFLLAKLVTTLYPHYNAFYRSNFYNSSQYLMGFMAISAIVFQFFGFIQKDKKERVENVHLGGMILLIILGAVCLIYVPTGSYFIIVPTFLYLLIQQAKRFFVKKNNMWIDGLSALIPVLLWTPMIYLFYVVFSLEAPLIPMAVFSLMMIFMLPIFKEAPRLWSILLLTLFVLSLIRGHVSSGISEKQPYQANWTYERDSDEQKIVMKDDVLDKVEKEYFPDAKLNKGRYEIASELNLPSPLSITQAKDTTDNEVTDIITVSSDVDVIRLRLWGELLAEAKSVSIRDIKVNIKEGRGISFMGDVNNEDVVIKIVRNVGSSEGEVTLESNQLGLIDKIGKDKTIIPGTGYRGGTIIHRQNIKI